MNAPAGVAIAPARSRLGTPAIWASLLVVACGSTYSRGDHSALPDQAVVVGDGLVESAPTIASELDGSAGTGQWVGAPADGFSGAVSQAMAPRWDIAVDALMLWQGNAQALPLLVDPAGTPVVDASGLRTQFTAGPRVSLIRSLGGPYSIEGNYFQARPFNAERFVPAGGGPYGMTNFGDVSFDDIESAAVTGSGWIQSAEFNWRKNECYSPITWIAGFRWVQLNSEFNMNYAFQNPDPYGTGSVNAVSGNDLYGGQIGADVMLWNRGGTWRLNGLGKAGVFYNTAYQRSSAGFVTTDGDPFPLGTVGADAEQTAFFGEIGLNSTYWITNWLAWRAGYSVFWAAGVAVAAQQLPSNSFGDGTAGIDTNGSVMLHGVTTGLEARW